MERYAYEAFYLAKGRGPYPSEMAAEPIVAAYLEKTAPGQRGLNLGCGGAPFAGWLNIDSDQPWHADIIWDLTQGLPMVPDGVIDAVYSEHFMEHIPRTATQRLLADCFRMLRSGGKVRIAMPDLDWMVNTYAGAPSVPKDELGEFTDLYGDLLGTRGEWLNIGMRAWGHTYVYNCEDLCLVLQAAGFTDLRRCEWRVSETPWLSNRETRDRDQSALIVEGRRP